MAKKQFFAILDSETTMEDTVADLGIIIVDRQGTIHNQCAILVKDHYGKFELFHDKNANDIWGYGGLQKRNEAYVDMLNSGKRMLASVNAANRWIEQAVGKYDPVLTAYNLAFDKDKCKKTGIILDSFKDSFCMWQAAIGNICTSKAYQKYALENHAIGNRTEYGNMTVKTNAEFVAGFVTGELIDEPHTALEDARDFERPILVEILKKKKWREKITPYNWRAFQVKDLYQVK